MSNFFTRPMLRLDVSSQRSMKGMSVSLLLLLTVGCANERPPQAELSLKVEPSNRPGSYTVSGKTNFPDQSQIIVQGIRPLTSIAQPLSSSVASNYAILDRQAVVVSQGQWQATLKLWQAKPDGQYQEVWQANQTSLSRLQPSAEVVFMATIDPASQPNAVAKQLEKQGKKLEGANVRFAIDGQPYLQAKQTLAVTLPTGKTTTSGLSANEANGGWGDRSMLSNADVSSTAVKLPALKEKQTTAPLLSSQRFR